MSRHWAVVGLALGWVLIAELDPGTRVGLFLAGIVILLVPLRRERMAGTVALWLPQTGWCIERDGQRRPAEVDPATRVFAGYVALILKGHDGCRYRFTPTPRGVSLRANRVR